VNLACLLHRGVAVFPDRPAVALGKTVLHDYRTLARRAAAIGRALTARIGLAPGDRIALCMPNCPQYLETLYGAWIAGLAVVPINHKLHPKEVAFILADSEAAVLFVTNVLGAGLQPLLSGLPALRETISVESAEYGRMAQGDGMVVADRGPDDLAWLFYTSGTTGRPKGVMLTHRNLMTMTLCYFTDVDQATRDDAIVYAAPMSHGAGMYNFAHVLVAARHVIPESGGFDAAEIFELASHHRNVSMFAAPTMVKRLVDHVEATGASSAGIKTVVYGGGPMYAADIKRALAVMGDRFVQIYGQGESPMTITALSRAHLGDRAHPRYEQRIASVGVAQSAVEVRVTDESGRALPVGETGEVVVRGDSVMRGYWRNPGATAQTLREGWLFTGDVGALDEDGFLTLKDRSKDVIISGGANIYPREVEEVLLKHPGVHEVSVVGRVHPEWGEEVVAFVVRRPGRAVSEAALDALCLDSIARFKRPKAYYFIVALPKNNYGKVLKTELREWLKRQGGGK
jgi:long-chain acyl-CoA synthetase